MRTREEILKELNATQKFSVLGFYGCTSEFYEDVYTKKEKLQLELLLDIRELLQK